MPGADEDLRQLDEALASRARSEAAIRLRLGQALEILSHGGVFDLGFSSSGAHATERCERRARWVEAARCMARRLERLPTLRQGLALGRISWSMGELLARVALPGDEARWLEAAAGHTVRQMRRRVAEELSRHTARPVTLNAHEASAATPEVGSDPTTPWYETVDAYDFDESRARGDEMCTLECTVEREQAWLLEATLTLLEQLGARDSDERIEALLAEAQERLLGAMPERGAIEPKAWQGDDGARERWLVPLAWWRAQAEILCERYPGWRLRRESTPGLGVLDAASRSIASAAAAGMASLERLSTSQLDDLVVALAQALARHELELSQLVLALHRVDGWRRLGYASEAQYARERLGTSRSSFVARRSLAARLEQLPRVAAALGSGQIGVEAALQIVRVATANTEAEWVARAQRRTIKHLREEVTAALAAIRWSGEADCPPPVDEEVAAFQALEQAVVSGRARPGNVSADGLGPAVAPWSAAAARPLTDATSPARRAWFLMLSSLAAWLDGGTKSVQMSAGPQASRARVQIRLRMSRATRSWWRALETQALDRLPVGTSWLEFLCLSTWQAWQHLLGADVAYGHIYVRDRYRCASPVCSRRDVTPHHLRFRSAGGSDDDANIGTVCSWCHLSGVHGGRIRATGTAEKIHWELGAPSSPCLVVHGRVVISGRGRPLSPTATSSPSG